MLLKNKINTKIRSKIILGIFVVIIFAIVFILFGNRTVDTTVTKSYIPLNEMNAGEINSPLPGDPMADGLDENFILCAQTEELRLYISKTTAEVAVANIESGYVWRSNPANREEQTLSGSKKSRGESQVFLEYTDTFGKVNSASSFQESILLRQYHFTPVKDGIAVEYYIGSDKIGRNDLSGKIEENKYKERIFDLLTEEDQRIIRRYYKLDKKLGAYILAEGVFEDEIAEIYRIYGLVGYTEEDIEADRQQYGLPEGSKRCGVRIRIEYTLEKGDLMVRIPMDYIDIAPKFLYRYINLLEFFGAPMAAAEGYFLLPNGTGAIMYFDAEDHQYNDYIAPIYGFDPNERKSGGVSFDTVGVSMPVYGIKIEDNAMFAVLEEGSSLASLCVDMPRGNPYYNVYFRFIPQKVEELKITSATSHSYAKAAPGKYEGNIKIRYTFLAGENADYVGMAKYYKALLNKAANRIPAEQDGGYPFYFEAIGAFEKKQSILGVPSNVTMPLTTFEQSTAMALELKQGGIENVGMRYSGWLAGGLRQKMLFTVNIESSLGKAKDLARQQETLRNAGVGTYYDIKLLRAEKYPLFINKKKYFATNLQAKYVNETLYYPGSFWINNLYKPKYYINPEILVDYTEGAAAGLAKMGVKNLSLSDIASLLYSSGYNKRNYLSREDTLKEVLAAAGLFAGSFDRIMLDGLSSYTMPYGDVIVNIDYGANIPSIVDEQVPFAEMVLRGYTDYAYGPVNLAYDERTTLLKTAESGASLYYTFAAENTHRLKESEYDYLYSIAFEDWKHHAVESYKKLENNLGETVGLQITGHEIIMPMVHKTTFGNNISVITNYSTSDIEIDGHKVIAGDYIVLHSN